MTTKTYDRCGANTQVGKACTRKAVKTYRGCRYCKQHYDFIFHMLAKQGPKSNAGVGWRVDPWRENTSDGRDN